ncbi:GGDEF domain-containing protein [Sporosarcina cascadiensis]|uniref:GGDEF domain-containing protein n=1 Tax=Sporosarcina cascadiensis TaxID=2660747 RepID=UPI00129A21D6|nr:sensor domain-containing diguanylate cyclase [Sporosarcina cascadiensis]
MDKQLNFAPCGYLTLNDSGFIVEINETMLRLLGYSLHELEGQHIHQILPSASRSFYQLYFFPMIRLQNKVEEMFFTFMTKDGQNISVLLNALRNEREGEVFNDCACLPMKNRFEYEQSILAAKRETESRNLMKRKQIAELDDLRRELEFKQNELLTLNKTLMDLAITDGLTGLSNRRFLQDRLSSYFTDLDKRSIQLAFLLIDIDFFKNINDTFGHLTGDNVLRKLALLLKEESGKEDVAARYGGEEFAFILPHCSKTEALRIAERIRFRVEHADWNTYNITISIGIAVKLPGDTEISLQSRADQALYSSKNNGRNQISFGRQE